MTRKKVDLTYITNESKRKATLKKRKNGLLKKVDEITTLCGIEACAIIYTPNEPNPEVWPSHWEVRKVLSKFKGMPELEQSKKMMNQESFLRQRILKAQDQLKKQRNENRKKELNHLMFQLLGAGMVFDNVNMMDLNDLSWIIDQNLKDINRMLSKNNDQAKEENSVAVDRAAIMKGEQAHLDRGQPVGEINMDVMQNKPWSMNFINGGGVEMPFGDPTPQICYMPTSSKP